MKVAVLKLGARIVFGDKVGSSGGSGEAANLINMLAEGGYDVHCYTKILNKDPIPEHVVMHDIESEFDSMPQYDMLFVINGIVNFFGGAEDRSQILNYWIMNHCKCPIAYLYCDPNLHFRQIWSSIEKKEWASNWNKEDIFMDKPFTVITQVHNISHAMSVNKKHGVVKTVAHYPFYKFPMMWDEEYLDNEDRPIDIIYGGTFRSGRRAKKLVDFYFGYPPEFNVTLFGKIRNKDFDAKNIYVEYPNFEGPVDYNQMIKKMSTGKAHIVIGDMKYPEFGMISQRAYESIKAGCVTFIDEAFDRKKVIFGHDKNLSKLLYVKDRHSVIKKMQLMSKDDIKTIAKLQYEAIGFDHDKYVRGFIKQIEEVVK